MLLYDPLATEQAKAEPGGTGREKGVEKTIKDLRSDAASGILYSDLQPTLRHSGGDP